ncbi:hypothetical protein JW979_04240 [bacterium]|nr:hypothetical protein [candidate division CSSED10-310 bacterium]
MRKLAVLAFIFCLGIPGFIHASVVNVPGDYPTIQAGIDAAVNGDTVLIADGTYSGSGNYDIDFKGKAIEVSSINGPGSCVVDCQEMGRGFMFQTSEANTSILMGLTVTNGSADNFGGGAVFCNAASPLINNCRFIGNQSVGYGGAIRYLDMGSGNWEMLYVVDCLFENNHTNNGGGGIAIDGSLNANILRCRLVNNHASEFGGGICCWASTTYISDTIISGNITDGEGGGMYYVHGYYPVTNCLLTENTANQGGAVSGDYGLKSYNCTVIGNSATDSGGAFFVTDMEPRIMNCIIRNNGSNGMVGFPDYYYTSYSNIEGIPPYIEGCFDEDPLFATGPSGEFYLSQITAGQSADSPCLNTGSDESNSICFPDEDGNTCMDTRTTRTDHISDQDTVDMGYHYSTDLPIPTPTPTPECDTLGCEVDIPAENFSPGDEFYCDVLICNPTDNMFENIPLYSVLDVYGEIFVLPPIIVDVPPGISPHTIIPTVIWPDNAGEGQATIYAAMTNEAVSELFGSFGYFQFVWTD